MDEQAVDAVLGGGKLGVVEVVRVNGNAVHECRKTRGSFLRGTNDGSHAIAASRSLNEFTRDRTTFGARTRQSQAESIQDGFLAKFNYIGWNVFVPRLENKVPDVFCE